MVGSRQQQPRVLVIDGDRAALEEMATVLGAADYAFHCCATAVEALAAAELAPPDLIISDVRVADCSGPDLVERIRTALAPTPVPAMFLSRTQVPDVIRRGDPQGGAYYLRKPLDPYLLVELIDTAMGRHAPEPVRLGQA